MGTLVPLPSFAVCSNNQAGNPGQNGEIEYFTGTNLLQYCDNTNWVDMKPLVTCKSCGGKLNERVVFVTSTTFAQHAYGGISAFDANCQALASASGLAGTYKAWISDNTTSPSIRFEHSTVPYVLPNGVTIANNWTDLTDGTIQSAINLNEFGLPYGAISGVASNTNTDGTVYDSGNHCGNFNGGAPFVNDSTMRGDPRRTDSGWTVFNSAVCSASSRGYCFEQNSLVGYWKLDETTGTSAIDSSPLANNGTYQNMTPAAQTVTGKVNNAINTDIVGYDGYITLPILTEYHASKFFTVSAWVNINDLTGAQGIISIPGYLQVANQFSANSLALSSLAWSGPGTFISAGFLDINEWVHLAITYNYNDPAGTLPKIYKNGVLTTTTIGVASTAPYVTPVAGTTYISRRYTTSGSAVRGLIDDIRLYNRILSASEIYKLAHCTGPGVYYYNSINDAMQWCDGVNSSFNMATPASGSGSCSPEGSLRYSTDRYQFCDGNGWVDVGK